MPPAKSKKSSDYDDEEIVAALEDNAGVRETHRIHKRFILDYRRGAIDTPIKASFRNMKLNTELTKVWLQIMAKTKDFKVPSIIVIGKVNDKYHSKWGAVLDGLESYTENWNVKRQLTKVRNLKVKFLKRPVMDSLVDIRLFDPRLGGIPQVL